MCRMLLMNKKAEKEIEKIYGLNNYLKYLEEELGGNGNGFALLKDNKIIKLEKGVNLKTKDIAEVFKKNDYDWALFHTRLATIGNVNDKNCHPFKRGDTVLAMNGTEEKLSFLTEIMHISDTEAILDTMYKYKLEIAALKHFNSIFMGFHKGKPFVVADNTYNIKILKNSKNGVLAFASSFPEKIKKIYKPTNCFLWNGGPLNIKLEKYKIFKKKSFRKYIYHNNDWGQYYFDMFDKRGDKYNENTI